MTSQGIILVLVVATVAFTNANPNTELECDRFKPGRYCNNDLSGFKICGEHGEVGSASCSAHYMCPCGFNRRCEEHASCVRRPKFQPNQIPASFSGSFTGRRIFRFPTGERQQFLNGIQCQDATPGDKKYSSLISFSKANNISVLIRREARIIRKDDSGDFVEYLLTVLPDGSQTCSKTKLERYTGYFENLIHNSIFDSSTNEYVSRDGPKIAAASGSLVEKWTLGDLHVPTQQNVPVTYQRIVNTGQYGKTNEDTKIDFQYYYLGVPNEVYFRVPEIC